MSKVHQAMWNKKCVLSVFVLNKQDINEENLLNVQNLKNPKYLKFYIFLIKH